MPNRHNRSSQHELSGRLLEEETGDPLTGYSVRATDLDAQPEPRDLGRAFTDSDGRFTLSYTVPLEAASDMRSVQLHILAQTGEETATRTLEVQPAQPETVTLHLSPPSQPEPGEDRDLRDITIGRPDKIIELLEERGVHTLADIRTFNDLNVRTFDDLI